MYFSLYAENYELATNIARKFTAKRLLSQIKPDGSMPEEMARTRPLFYSIYNLHAMLLVAHFAEKVDVDVYEKGTADSKLRAALDYLAPYSDASKSWPTETVGECDRMELFAVLQIADIAYPDGNYLKYAESLAISQRNLQRSKLVIPLMR